MPVDLFVNSYGLPSGVILPMTSAQIAAGAPMSTVRPGTNTGARA